MSNRRDKHKPRKAFNEQQEQQEVSEQTRIMELTYFFIGVCIVALVGIVCTSIASNNKPRPAR